MSHKIVCTDFPKKYLKENKPWHLSHSSKAGTDMKYMKTCEPTVYSWMQSRMSALPFDLSNHVFLRGSNIIRMNDKCAKHENIGMNLHKLAMQKVISTAILFELSDLVLCWWYSSIMQVLTQQWPIICFSWTQSSLRQCRTTEEAIFAHSWRHSAV